jgi:outer membrane lipoprotein-sorting protein
MRNFHFALKVKEMNGNIHPMKRFICCAAVPALFAAQLLWFEPSVLAQSGGAGVSIHAKTPPAEPPTPPAEPQPQQSAPQTNPAASQETSAATAEPAGQEDPQQAGIPEPTQAAPEGLAQPDAQTAGSDPSNPVGANKGWDAQFGTAPPRTSQFTGAPEQIAVVEKINAYFNNMTNLEGNFLQTDANDSRRKGKFFLQRPGKVLFDYSLPSKQKIISNGKYLAIEDHDLNTTDRYPLESTPFRLLLKEHVNLAEDAYIAALDVGENIVVLTVEDKEARGGGQIRLFFDWPELQLREWIITDAQGLNTRIELASLEANKEVDPKLFTFSKEVGMPRFRGGSN